MCFTGASFFSCLRILAFSHPPDPRSSASHLRGSSSVSRLSSLTALQSYHPDLAIHLLPPPSFTMTVFVCLCVCVGHWAAMAVIHVCPATGPENSSASWLMPLALKCQFGVVKKRAKQDCQEVCLTFSSKFIAGDVSEDNHRQPCNPLNCTSKDDNIWLAEMICRHQTWTITYQKFEEVCVKPVYKLLFNRLCLK